MDLARSPANLRLKWFIGVQVYGSQGGPIWIVRGPFAHQKDLERAQAELKAIAKASTEPYQAGSLAEARRMCAAQARNGKAP